MLIFVGKWSIQLARKNMNMELRPLEDVVTWMTFYEKT